MKNDRDFKYFNEQEFKNILRLKESGNIPLLLEECQKYFKKYPYDPSFITTYASILISNQELDKAEEVLSCFTNTKTIIEENYAYYYDNLIKLFGNRKNYDACYSILIKQEKLLKKYIRDYYFRQVYLQKMLGLPIETDLDKNKYSYLMNQAISYDPLMAIKHVSESHNAFSTSSVFKDGFDISENFVKIRNLILSYKDISGYLRIFRNVFYFQYDGIGVDVLYGKKSNYLKVITFQDTDEILSMFPIIKPPIYFKTANITSEMICEEEGKKVKRISQIEKFNKRYQK